MFEYFSRANGTKMTVIRLNYANETRYGVLVDIAQQVFDETPIDLTQGHANVVWQGDCNKITLRSLDIASSPPKVLNLAGPKIAVRDMAEKFAANSSARPRTFTGEESDMAMLNNGANCWNTFGEPSVSVDADVRAHRRVDQGRPRHLEQAHAL